MYKSTGNEIVPFYCHRPGRTIDTIEILYDVMRDMKTGAVVFYLDDWEELEDVLDMMTSVIKFKVGNKKLVCGLFDILTTEEPLRY